MLFGKNGHTDIKRLLLGNLQINVLSHTTAWRSISLSTLLKYLNLKLVVINLSSFHFSLLFTFTGLPPTNLKSPERKESPSEPLGPTVMRWECRNISYTTQGYLHDNLVFRYMFCLNFQKNSTIYWLLNW